MSDAIEPKRREKPENTLISLACNILLPILILNKLTTRIGPGPALALALAFPLGYGAWDLYQRRKANPISILGLLNTLITGGLAWVGVTGFWFAVKEAAFPALVGVFVFVSAWTRKPAIEVLFLNPNLFHLDRMKEKIAERGQEDGFKNLLRTSTRWLAISFFLSAVLNFLLASRIFLPIADDMEAGLRSAQLNEQIAQMTQWSMLVILVPSMIFLMAILYFVIRRLKFITGLGDDELLKLK